MLQTQSAGEQVGVPVLMAVNWGWTQEKRVCPPPTKNVGQQAEGPLLIPQWTG